MKTPRVLNHRCLEGTKKVPRGFKGCCETFAGHTTTCTFDIRYEWWPKLKTWVIVIDESAGGGGITIGYCPHCGKKLNRGQSPRRTK